MARYQWYKNFKFSWLCENKMFLVLNQLKKLRLLVFLERCSRFINHDAALYFLRSIIEGTTGIALSSDYQPGLAVQV